MINRKDYNKDKFRRIVLIALIVIFVIIGIFIIKDSFCKIDNSKSISEKILMLYLDHGK